MATLVPDIGPTGFPVNQFLIGAEPPLLFHTGPRSMYPSVSAAPATLIDRRPAELNPTHVGGRARFLLQR